MKKNKIIKLKEENKILKETCEVLSDERLLKDINLSLKQIREGRGMPLSKL